MADAKQFEALSLEFSQQQTNLNELMTARSQLETQYQENKIVLNEFESLNEESKIYKLTGPVLLPQEYSEAKMNVSKRIEFIEGEIKRVEDKIEKEEADIGKSRDKILALRAQQSQGQAQSQ
jgi:prefoldin beta subunit